MKIIKTIKGLRQELAAVRRKGRSVGFVPTMGYFHEGHLSLMRRSVQQNDVTVVSVFVNPTQFGPKEDLARYPRDLKRDSAMARGIGVDILFVPSVEEMYPDRIVKRLTSDVRREIFMTTIDVGPIGDILCGASRPGHFRGVATVVAKLLHMVQPDRMYFGQKDAQQVVVLQKMVRDLNLPGKIIVVATVREPDGLAMSSRNIYLSPTERNEASVLYRALRQARRRVLEGESDAAKIICEIKKLILEKTSASIEYVSCVTATDLSTVRRIGKKALIVLAVRFRSARLIDNMTIPTR